MGPVRRPSGSDVRDGIEEEDGVPNAKRGRREAPPSAFRPAGDQQSLMAPVVKLMLLPLCGVPMGARQAPSVMLAAPAHV